MGRTGSHTDL